MCKYYGDKIGQAFEWIISGTIPAWFFVEVENTAEWFVSIDQVLEITWNKNFNFEADNMKFEFNPPAFDIPPNKGDLRGVLQVWDNIKIKIWSIEMDKRRLNFDFLEKIIK